MNERFIAESLRISEAIELNPDTVEFRRSKLNKYNEPDGDELVVRLTGQYYKAKTSLSVPLNVSSAGNTKGRENEKFIAVIDDTTLLIKEGDFFTLKGIKYKIVDLGNVLDVYFDMSIERG